MGNSLPRTPLLLGLTPHHDEELPRMLALMGPDPTGNGLLQTPVLLGLAPCHREELPWTPFLLGPGPFGTGLLRTGLLLGLALRHGEGLQRSADILLGPVSMRAGLPWTQVQMGLFSTGNGLWRTRLRVMLGLSPLGRKLPWTRSPVHLSPFRGSGYRGRSDGCQVLRDPDVHWLDSQFSWVPRWMGDYYEPWVTPCWAVSSGRSGYRRQPARWCVIQEPDYHRHTCRPTDGDGLSRWPSDSDTAPDEHLANTARHGTAGVTQPWPGQQSAQDQQWAVNHQAGATGHRSLSPVNCTFSQQQQRLASLSAWTSSMFSICRLGQQPGRQWVIFSWRGRECSSANMRWGVGHGPPNAAVCVQCQQHSKDMCQTWDQCSGPAHQSAASVLKMGVDGKQAWQFINSEQHSVISECYDSYYSTASFHEYDVAISLAIQRGLEVLVFAAEQPICQCQQQRRIS